MSGDGSSNEIPSSKECILSSIGRKFIQESILPSVKGTLIGTLQIEINSDQILSNVGFGEGKTEVPGEEPFRAE